MPQQPLVIVPVTLRPIAKTNQPNVSANSTGFCTITLAHAEITFQNDVDEHIIQTILKELIER